METYDIYGNYLQEMSLLSESDLDYGYWHKYWRLFFLSLLFYSRWFLSNKYRFWLIHSKPQTHTESIFNISIHIKIHPNILVVNP